MTSITAMPAADSVQAALAHAGGVSLVPKHKLERLFQRILLGSSFEVEVCNVQIWRILLCVGRPIILHSLTMRRSDNLDRCLTRINEFSTNGL